MPIGDRALAWLEKYLREVGPELALEPDDGRCFSTRNGEPFSRDHLSGMVQDYVEAAKIGKSGACHICSATPWRR